MRADSRHNFAGCAIEDEGPTGKQLYVYFDATALREFKAGCDLAEAGDDLYARTTEGPVYEIHRFVNSLHDMYRRPLLGGSLADALSLNWKLCECVADAGGSGRFELRLPIPEQPNV